MEGATAESMVEVAQRVPNPQPRPKRPRVQLDFTQEAYERLKALMTMARVDSIADMFRDALRLYEFYQVRKQEGYTVRIMLEKNGRSKEVDLGL